MSRRLGVVTCVSDMVMIAQWSATLGSTGDHQWNVTDEGEFYKCAECGAN